MDDVIFHYTGHDTKVPTISSTTEKSLRDFAKLASILSFNRLCIFVTTLMPLYVG